MKIDIDNLLERIQDPFLEEDVKEKLLNSFRDTIQTDFRDLLEDEYGPWKSEDIFGGFGGFRYSRFKLLVKVSEEYGAFEEFLPIYLQIVEEFQTHKGFVLLLRISDETGILQDHFSIFLDTIEDLLYPTPDNYDQRDHSRVVAIGEHKLRWKSFDPRPRGQYNILSFSDLIYTINNTDLIDVHYDRIAAQFLRNLEIIDTYPLIKFRGSLYRLIVAIRNTKLITTQYLDIEKMFLSVMEHIQSLPFQEFMEFKGRKTRLIDRKFREFLLLFDAFQGTRFVEVYFEDLFKIYKELVNSIKLNYPEILNKGYKFENLNEEENYLARVRILKLKPFCQEYS